MVDLFFMRALFGTLVLAAGCAATSPRPALNEVLPFVQDDYVHALAEAKARQLPLFVDGWAPW
jgi:hypothetical protein